MTTINKNQPHHLDLQHEERVQRCAELGQIVPRSKAQCREHYEAMLAQVQQEAAANVDALR